MSRWTPVVAGLAGVFLISIATLVTAGIAPPGDIWWQTGAAFLVAALLAPARRRILGRGPVFFDDFLRDIVIHVAIGAFSAACTIAAQRFIGGYVSPGLPAAIVFLIGPSEGQHKRMWGVRP